MESVIKKVMSEIFEISITDIGPNSSMDNISSWDSLGHLQLIIQLEEKLGVSFNERETLAMISFESIVKTLDKKSKRNGNIQA